MSGGPYTLLMALIQGEGAAYKAVANGAVAQLDPGGRDGMGVFKLNPYVVEGEPNRIELEVAPPSGRTDFPLSAAIGVRILEGPEGIDSSQARVVLEHVWTQRNSPAVGPQFMNVFSSEYTTQVAHGRWAWQDATPFTPADRADIEALVTKIHTGFSNANYGALAALTKVRDEEMARGLGMTYADLEARSRSASQTWFGADDFRTYPLDLSAMVLRPRAGGRLVEVNDERELPLVRANVDGKEVRPPFTVSHLADGWAVVR